MKEKVDLDMENILTTTNTIIAIIVGCISIIGSIAGVLGKRSSALRRSEEETSQYYCWHSDPLGEKYLQFATALEYQHSCVYITLYFLYNRVVQYMASYYITYIILFREIL